MREIERRSRYRHGIPAYRAAQREYRQRAVEKYRATEARFREKNREYLRKYSLNYYHENVKDERYLAEMAIRAMLRSATGASPSGDLPAELIEAKVAELRLKRLIADLKRATT